MFKKFLVFISVLAIAYSSKAQVNVQDSLALVALYKSTGGGNWGITWDLSQPVNTWRRITISNGRVTELLLFNNQLSGSIPGELGKLTQLTELSLSNNYLSGSIPGKLGNLINLTELNLSWNNLRTSIPREFSNLINLTELNLSNNYLSGSIPGELGNLINLTGLYLSNNKLGGSIPGELGKLNKLTSLDLYANQLSENIPRELGKLTQLTVLDLRRNALSGNIPGELGKLTQLTVLDLRRNALSGNIPGELGNLINLTSLWLRDNQLSGSIPEELGKLNKLTLLALYANQLSGNIPGELGNLINLTSLWLRDNQLNGSIPGELGKLINLRYLYLSSNQLSGSIPVEFGKLNKLTELSLDNNQFDELPDLSSLTSLSVFRVENNRLDFGDILPNINVLTDYSPQKPIRKGIRYNPSIGDELILSVQVDGINNVYQWFKDNIALSSANDDTLKLSNIQTADHGLYHCRVINSGAPDLTLRSIPDTVVNSIPTDITLSSTTIEENKAIGTMIGILSTTDPDANDNHTYNLSGIDAHSFQIIEDTLKNAAIFNYETKSSYTITIQTEDARGLTFQKNFTISIDRFTALDELDISNEVIIYPNPSKKNIVIEINNLLISEGFIKIYSLNGKNEKSFLFEENKVKQIFILTISDLPSGMYILHGEMGDYFFTERIFKK